MNINNRASLDVTFFAMSNLDLQDELLVAPAFFFEFFAGVDMKDFAFKNSACLFFSLLISNGW